MNGHKAFKKLFKKKTGFPKFKTISQKADRYYISILVGEKFQKNHEEYTKGVGIDLGLKDFAIVSNSDIYKNINKTAIVKKISKKSNKTFKKM